MSRLFIFSWSHSDTHHSRYDSSGWGIGPSQRPLPDNTSTSQETNIHASGGIRTYDPSKRSAAHRRLRRCGQGDRRENQSTWRKASPQCSLIHHRSDMYWPGLRTQVSTVRFRRLTDRLTRGITVNLSNRRTCNVSLTTPPHWYTVISISLYFLWLKERITACECTTWSRFDLWVPGTQLEFFLGLEGGGGLKLYIIYVSSYKLCCKNHAVSTT
jgi:hypothetical protein